jgi:hypothetical protein
MALTGKPQPMVLELLEHESSAVVALTGARDSSLPEGIEAAPVFADWAQKHGARLFSWNGYEWTLDVTRPPTGLAALRKLADTFALVCPAARSARGALELEEGPALTMARLELRRWRCHWFIE